MYDDILLFIQLVEVGSFSKLSTITGVSQSTISRRIANLEHEMKIELVIRTTNNFRLSNAGILLYDKFKHHKVYLDETLHDIRSQFGLGIKGTLKVALPVLLSKTIIAPYIGNFLAKYPDIDLLISYRSGYIDLIQDGFDAAVTIYKPNLKNYQVKTLKNFYIQLYATPEYLQQFEPIDTLEQAINQSTVGFMDVNGEYTAEFTAINLKTGEQTNSIIPHPRIYIDNLINAYELASSHKMMITAWDDLVAEELKSGKLVKVLPDYHFREISCCLVLPSLTPTFAQTAFANFILECYSHLD